MGRFGGRAIQFEVCAPGITAGFAERKEVECDHISVMNATAEDAMDSRIAIDPAICHGQACIKGARIPVHQVLPMLACGDTIEDLLLPYPALTRADILACFDYGASLAEEQVKPIDAL